MVALCIAALSLIGITARAQSFAAPASADRQSAAPAGPWSDLLARAHTAGHVRIIVTLRLPSSRTTVTAEVRKPQTLPVSVGTARTSLIASLHGTYARVTAGQTWSFPLVALDVGTTALGRLRASPLVAAVEADGSLQPADTGSNTAIGAPQAWGAGYMGANQTIAVLDTGLQENPSILGSRLVGEACFSGGGLPSQSLCPNGQVTDTGAGSAVACTLILSCAHGTGMIDIAAGDSTSSGGASFQGVAPQAQVLAVQVYSVSGTSEIQAYESDVISGLNWVSQQGTQHSIAAVNLSFASVGRSFSTACDAQDPAMTAAIAALRSENIATVVASGNEGSTSGIAFPACVSSAINVGAVDDAGQVASISNRGPDSMFWAPGVDIAAVASGSGYLTFTGTSDSAAMVSGAIAVLRSARPGLTVDQIVAALQSTGTRISDTASDTTLPLIQLAAAISAVGGSAALLSPTSTDTVTNTPLPTSMPTQSSTSTSTATSTATGTATGTSTPTDTDTATATETASPSSTATRTPEPTSTQPPRLQVSASPVRITGNGYTTVSLQTVRGASVSATFRLTEQKLALVDQRGQGVWVTRNVTLFQTSVTGLADRLGRFQGRLHVLFVPRKPMAATILIEVRSGRSAASATVKVTVNPKQ